MVHYLNVHTQLVISNDHTWPIEIYILNVSISISLSFLTQKSYGRTDTFYPGATHGHMHHDYPRTLVFFFFHRRAFKIAQQIPNQPPPIFSPSFFFSFFFFFQRGLMKFQSKQKQVKKLAGQAAHKPGEVAAAKAAQCAIQCPVCRVSVEQFNRVPGIFGAVPYFSYLFFTLLACASVLDLAMACVHWYLDHLCVCVHSAV